MKKSGIALVAGLLLAAFGLAACSQEPTAADDGAVVVVPARAGAVDGTIQNSDEFIWRLFAEFVAPFDALQPSPVVFETWASDADTFSTSPQWPDPDQPKKLQASVLGTFPTLQHGPVDVACLPPKGAAAAGFPTSGTPTPCIAEEVKRNRPQFDYIVGNNLNTKAGLATAFSNSVDVQMPTTALSVKGDWVPVETLLQWLPELGSIENIRKLYYTNVSDSVEYAVVALHVSSRQNPNWVWGTFEHQMNPGRCDDLGCYDTFGATVPVVPPDRTEINTQYGPCEKTEDLQEAMASENVSAVWDNYCLKSTQVDYVDADGTPNALGNSTIERIVGNGTIVASSCIACHVYASFGADGAPTAAATNMLPYNPTGEPIPAVLDGSLRFDFMWGVVLAP